MTYRAPLLMSIALGLSGCASPAIPTLGFSELQLPRVDVFNYAIPDRSIPTEPYTLTPAEADLIKSTLSAAYKDGRVLRFGPISARRSADNSLVVCGLVDVPTATGTYTGMSLFDGSSRRQDDGTLAFEPRRIAGRNAPSMDVYIGCRDAGLI
ncbi:MULTISPECIES: hypothetical protein [unclassified Aureimonas]|uniref:hypothetical protein n=1 Tax=unclassified Aureimonas TaxID=2615206 RepID=UPI0006FEC53F|nr:MULTISPECIES: hypothetical protein [unclassified Aureimonas]KQT55174.1 hypothetical protein ASG62_10010 [Aureimonas sp. Leaf427]KQT70963.1 hypothetical protein ASG54_20395 [Aureimonas sp. Leaf460]